MEAEKKNNSMWTDMIRPVVVLVVICLVASALLGVVNAKTATAIHELNAETHLMQLHVVLSSLTKSC